MKLVLASLAAVTANLSMVGNTAGWAQSGAKFTGAGAWSGRQVFLGKEAGGGMCASADAHIEAIVHLPENRYGELGSVSMRASSETGSMGYTCKLDTRKGQGIMLTRDGKKPNNCVHRDFHLGKPTRYDPSVAWRNDLDNQCFIRDRAWTMYNGATDYNVKMTIVENVDNTVTVECSVDGELMAWYTDPCPLTGGEYALATSRNSAEFNIQSYTDRSCNDVPAEVVETPSLADGLTLIGMGKTAKFWKSAGQDTVTHYYSGACNSAGGKNREAGAGVYGGSASYGARSDALNVAALKPAQCVKDGFIEADVTLVADYLNGPSGQYGAGNKGNAGLLMRVESDSHGKDHKMGVNYDSWGYMFQVSLENGKFSVYRGNNGGDHNKNSIAAGYLTGRYRCKNCKCSGGWDGCEQFSQPTIGSTHRLRLELSTSSNDRTHVKAFLNGTLVADVTDQEHHRYKRWMGTAPSADTNMCGDFGLATYDSDVVSYKVTDYTGYVPQPKGIVAPVEIELIVEEFTEAKKEQIIAAVAAQLGVSAADVTVAVGGRAARRLLAGMMVTVTVKVSASQAATIAATLESPTFAAASGAEFVGVHVAADAPVAFTQKWDQGIAAKAREEAFSDLGMKADRYYNAHESRACCVKKCGSNQACQKGCVKWIGHTSLNWVKKEQALLHAQCRKHCTKSAKGMITFTHTPVAGSEEQACITGCNNYNQCW